MTDRTDADKETLSKAGMAFSAAVDMFAALVDLDSHRNPTVAAALVKEIKAGLAVEARLTFDTTSYMGMAFYALREGREPELLFNACVRNPLNS